MVTEPTKLHAHLKGVKLYVSNIHRVNKLQVDSGRPKSALYEALHGVSDAEGNAIPLNLSDLQGILDLVNEQREVIRQLVDALSRHQNYCRVIDPENFCECMGCQAGRALRSAAPFLQQED